MERIEKCMWNPLEKPLHGSGRVSYEWRQRWQLLGAESWSAWRQTSLPLYPAGRSSWVSYISSLLAKASYPLHLCQPFSFVRHQRHVVACTIVRPWPACIKEFNRCKLALIFGNLSITWHLYWRALPLSHCLNSCACCAGLHQRVCPG